MRKIIILLCIIMMITLVSAASWDNVGKYTDNDMKITIKNYLGLFGWLGIDDDVGEATLTSHESINYVKNVMPGKGRVVMYYDFNNWEGVYEKGLGKVYFTDMRTGKKIDKDYYFAQAVFEDVVVEDYEINCVSMTRFNGTIYEKCNEIKIGSHVEQRLKRWERLNSDDIPSGSTRIALITDVGADDYIDGIWTIAGVKVKKHAAWTAAFNVGLVAYYSLNDTAAPYDAQGVHNGTNGGAGSIAGVSGNAYNFTGSEWFTIPNLTSSFTVNATMNVWIKFTNTADTPFEYGNASAADSWHNPEGTIYTDIFRDDRPPATGFSAIDGNYHMFTITQTPGANGYKIYENSSLIYQATGESIVNIQSATMSNFGRSDDSGTWLYAEVAMDELGIWSRPLTQAEITDLWNGGSGIFWTKIAVDASPVVDLTSPPDTHNSTSISIEFNGTASDNYDLINVSIWLDDQLNQTNTSGLNASNYIFTIGDLAVGSHNWTYEACDNASQCTNATFRTFTVASFFEIEKTSSDFTLETETESFIINISTNGSIPTSAFLNYNGTDRGTATITNTGGNNFNISRTIDIPVGVGNNTWNFNITLNGLESNSTPHQQRVVPINLTICGVPPQDKPYMNFTFTNETAGQEDVGASIDTTWVYYLGTGIENKSLSYTNSTESHNYTFCFYPENQTISTTLDMRYTNTRSQQRRYNPTLLTLSNVTTTQKLYLLPTILGLFSQFRTEDTLGSTLVGVNSLITRTLVGTPITVTSDVTDGSGLVVFFLDPDITYTAAFSLSGYSTNTFTFVPITGLRTVIMASLTEIPTNGSTIAIGTTYEIQPNNDSLNNNTIVTFSFNVTSGQTITLISMNITNTTHQIGFQNNAGTGFISEDINTRNNTRMFGEFIIQTANETTVVKRVWNIGASFVGDYSLFNQMVLYKDYGFNFFWRLLIVVSVIIGLLFLMSKGNQLDDEIKIAAVICVILGFSVVGWLDTGIMIDSSSEAVNDLAKISSQFGIAILTTATGLYFILRRVFRQI